MKGEARWFFGFMGTWLALSFMAESRALASLATALAIAIAVSITFIAGPQAAQNLALGKV